jgi:hypothetical protein
MITICKACHDNEQRTLEPWAEIGERLRRIFQTDPKIIRLRLREAEVLNFSASERVTYL